jgi:hypothetical protein
VRIPRQLGEGIDVPRVEQAAVLPIVVTVDDSDSAIDIVDALALAAFTTGREPYATTANLSNVRAEAELVPAGTTVLREAVESNRRIQLASGDGWTLRAMRWRNTRSAQVTVTATDAELAEKILHLATDGVVDDPPPPDEAVLIGFWHLTLHGPRRQPRAITAAPWADIRRNYASTAAEQLDRIMTVDRDSIRGRLLLLYGPPGTGKTTALRALAREWRSWCQVDCVLDPERLFAEPGYLLNVALDDSDNHDCDCDEDDTGHKRHKWRLLLLEDCDELIHGEAKQATGQALSRLLNLTDGLLGQGRDVLVAITTNEDLARLHPAVVRPGRCMASIEVPALPHREASGWLGTTTGIAPGGATLAELYALREGDLATVASREPVLSGQYL